MKKLLMSFVIASTALTAAAPAAAQSWERDRYQDRYVDDREFRGDRNFRGDRDFRGPPVQVQLSRLNQQIERGRQRGTLTNNEARRLRGEVQQLFSLAGRFHRTGGIDQREHFELQRRIGWVRQQLRFERRDDDRRWR